MKKLIFSLFISILILNFTCKVFSAGANIDKFIQDLGSDDITKIKQAQDQLLLLKEEAVPGLINGLEDKNVQIRGYAAVTLGMMKAKGAVDNLIKSLKDQSSSVRVSAIWALGEIKDIKSVRPLEEIYENGSGLEKLTSAVSLLHKGQSEKITVIIEFLMDENGYIRNTAANALADLRGEPRGDYEEVGKLLDILCKENVSEEELNTAGKSLIEKKLHSLYPLIEALNDKKEEKRATAALYLGELCNDISIIPLGITLKRDNYPLVRSSVAQSLKKINDSRSLPYLKDALNKETDKTVRNDIEDAIKNIQQ